MHHADWRVLPPVLLPAAAVLAACVGFTVAAGLDPSLATRDVASIGGVPPMAGVLSSLGILGWWTSAVVWLFLAAVDRAGVPVEARRFARASGGLSAWLALDDLFQFHELIAPQLFGLPERLVMVALAVWVAAYLWRFRRLVVHPEALLLQAALVALAASVLVDQMPQRWAERLGPWGYVLEDGLKWLGIVCWCSFAITWCRGRLAPRAAAPATQTVQPRLISGV